ncbi:MAG TPA: UvrD-helicase domain-containing protein [Candidatus Goldiibacteriota bacterium]|nr:UvrD-helicase domain-containing protein [Candidatus Goldiibacteriota bacterium]
MDLKQLLNKEQYEAVCHKDGPLLILAGAGSGKTRVITYRIANLISAYGVEPGHILAVTFTNKAAGEMKERIRSVIGKKAEEIWMSTFHSLGCRLLRQHADVLGYTKAFSIYDEDDRERLVKECMHQAKVSDKDMKPNQIIRYISDIKNQLLSPAQFEEIASDYNNKIVSRVYGIYEEKMKRNNAMDFDDLIKKPIELFDARRDILDAYREKFRYILIDEYQDINNSQYTLVSMLAEKYRNICVVGDDDQSIYRFRGADITNILEFEDDYKDAKVIRLEQNYRSTKNILRAAHSVIRNNKGRKDKELWTENNEGGKIVFYYTDDEIAESEAVLHEVDRLMRVSDVSLRQMAVFYRTNAQSRVIEDRFRRAGLPYKLVGGISFYGRMEIKDLLAYLRIVSNPHDIISFKRIINVPPRGIGDASIDRVEENAMEKGISFIDGLLDAASVADIKDSVKNTLVRFGTFIKHLHDNKSNMKLQDIMKEIISRTGYLEYWMKDTSVKARDRVENIKELVSALSEYEEGNAGASLEDFLNQVALISDVDKMDDKAEAVTLMTIHSAKGLEFDVVFLTGMDEGLFPHKNSIDEPGGIEEERRLAYVGITRARKKLYLFSAVSRRQYGTKKLGQISRYINEIPPELLEHKGRMPVKTVEEKYLKGSIEDTISDMEPEFDMPVDVAPTYKPGQKVKHKKMGAGVIVKIEPHGDDFKLTVNFKAHGKKVLSANHAGLEKI